MSAVLLALALLPGACLAPPVIAPVIDPFRAPPCAQCAGNRGLEYGTRPGTPVTAVAAGTVSFSGVVAGTRYVVVLQAGARRATYGRLASATVSVGATVATGAVIGTTTTGLFFGLRDGDTYIDPTPLLGAWRFRPRLIPSDGTPQRPSPPAQLRCPDD
ncbi:MAG: peptidase family protein [Ilumatobacteraceae bacterium]|nr:peptidase family protein [Ilumatobacteraceae bacterium]